ncbi:hypothetical protein GALMADRAFT_230616 [Galerina marginata CBS 339.88]|uniref:Cytochrome P450 n=1 Tax=Galerina marginata (strain CBS 339.88) TaxID=685588 RepID=A0A067SPR4_GALM3|nr:hypothetical protein GALMADRAFT_230616 [Galerina marginata CBS 339.88]
MPPGPRGLPLLGNVFEMPTKLPWIRFAEFAEQYGPIVSFVAAGHPMVVLNDHRSSFELLERRSAIYSHRPRFIMAGEILCKGIMLSFISYGDLFRRMKRATHNTFSPNASEQFQPLQETEAIRLASELLEDPDSWETILKRSTSSNILTATYGWPRITEEHRPLVKRIHEHTARLSNACIPGTSMVDIFPSMNRLPIWMVKWKRNALEWHERETKMFEGFYTDVGKNIGEGRALSSFTSSLIENQATNKLSVKEAAWLAGIMFSAGAETTTASVANFLLAMIHYPHVMRKAQAEIDRVVGRDRLPSFKDKMHLPYTRALVKELLRWRPPGPMGIPRRVAQDDWFDGYLIPKDTAVYDDPEKFLPERHLDEAGVTEISPPDMHSRGHTSFGFGRRTCVGVTFATQSLFIDFALLLWTFDVQKARDAIGVEITPSLTDVVDAGVTVGPAPFRCKLVPRYPDVGTVLARGIA